MRGFFLTVKRNSWDLGAHHSGSRLLLRPAPGWPVPFGTAMAIRPIGFAAVTVGLCRRPGCTNATPSRAHFHLSLRLS